MQRAGGSLAADALTGFEALGIPVYYGDPGHAHFDTPGLVVRRCPDSAWQAILSAPENSLRWVPVHETLPTEGSAPFDDEVPVLFWGEECETGAVPFAERLPNGTVVFNADILAATFFMLSRWEEIVAPACDEHDRFPASASVAFKQGFLDYPIVDYYALILREWLKVILPRWQPVAGRFKVAITHDIDHIHKFNGLRSFAAATFGALVRENSFGRFWQTVQELYFDLFDPSKGINGQTILDLAAVSERHGFASTFFFMACSPQKFQDGYDPSKTWLRNIYSRLLSNGHEIGFHAGYTTLDDSALLIKEKRKLEKALGGAVNSIRRHYLRFRSPESWRDAEQAGFTRDFTLGYADHEGFRAGTCHVYHPFDLNQDRELNIEEVPLAAMDSTFLFYRKMAPEIAKGRILQLACKCLEVGGTFTLLWHNTFLGNPAWDACYFETLGTLAFMQQSQPPIREKSFE